MNKEEALQIIESLGPKLTDKRRAKIDAVVNGRTRSLVTVIENITDQGNVNACMRSAEAFGCLDFNIIESEGTATFRPGGRVSKGAEKWLDVHTWDSTTECLSKLKADGFQVVVTYLDTDAKPIYDVDFSKPTVIVMGNEHKGASQEALDLADQTVYIPMSGFVESFNISVACALGLQAASLNRGAAHADLSDDDKVILTADYYKRTLPKIAGDNKVSGK